MGLPFAEDIKHYWQTSQTSPDSWMKKTKDLIEKMGGIVLADAYGNDLVTGKAAFMLTFEIEGDNFKILWPVLPSRGKNDHAARIQAVTLLHHDVKAKCMKAAVFGARAAFFSYCMLPDGRTAVEASVPELAKGVPAMLRNKNYDAAPQLEEGDVIDGAVRENEPEVMG